MNTLKLQHRKAYQIVQLDRGKGNPINAEMVDELRTVFNKAKDDDEIQGVILTGKEGYFSVGFDLIELYDYDKVQIRNFWTNFFVLMVEMIKFPKPLIAAVTGHSPAGGCVLAFCADYRIMAMGNYLTGMNEIAVGIVVPHSLFKLYSYWIGRRRAYLFLIEGRLFRPEEAQLYQLVDQIAPQEQVLKNAEEKMEQYLQFDPDAWRKSKMHLRQDLINSLHVDFDITNKDTLDQWWSPKARKLLKEIVSQLRKKHQQKEVS